MTKKILAAAAFFVGTLVVFGMFMLLAMSTVLADDSSNSGDRPGIDGGELDPGTIPNPEWVDAVIAAGNMCPSFPAPIIAAQIQTESNWQPDVVSPVGAMGLAQFMPATWEAFGVDGDGDGVADPFNPIDAIYSMGTFDCYLVEYLADAGGPSDTRSALAAYNAGPAPVLDAGGVPPIHETQQYVRLILERAGDYGTIDNGGGLDGPPPTDPTEQAAAVIAAAKEWEGISPYSWGGGNYYGPSYGTNSKGDCTGCSWDGRDIYGFDCSGLMQYAFHTGADLKLPRTTKQLVHHGQPVAVSDMQPGDIVVFDNPKTGSAYHVALFVGGTTFIHAEQPGTIVATDDLFNHPFWSTLEWHPRRVLGGTA